MSQVKVPLIHGYKIGDTTLMEAVLREFTSADLLDAQMESEQLVSIEQPGGSVEPELVTSPSLFGINVFRRQIAHIGDIEGPFTLDMVKKLHPNDLNLLQAKANELDSLMNKKTASKAVTQRGRSKEDTDSA